MDHSASEKKMGDVSRSHVLREYGKVGRPVRVVTRLDADLGLVDVAVELDRQGGSREKVSVTECLRDVISLLAKTGHRLTTSQVLGGLAKEGKVHGDSTVKTALARAVKQGLLDKRSDAKPPGYGMPGRT